MEKNEKTGNQYSHRVKNHLSVELLMENFKKHLDIDDNLRIFFSAKFGSGKTYFLHEFFDFYSSDYEVIKLFPINYTTANNKDIFELIKFDILFHLIRFHESKIDQSSISTFLKIQWFLHGKLKSMDINFTLEFLEPLLDIEAVKSNLPSWTTTLTTLQKIFKIAKKGYDEFLTKVSNDDLDLSDCFLEQIMKEFHEYEHDPITQIIKNTLNKIYDNGNGKKIVLLIDDLDRLDPDHLFRLLNIFGNHLSLSSGNKVLYLNENKFGFHKIILVGDIRNVHSIYEHRYGSKADFEGYFSKYYSKDIYKFDIRAILLKRDNYTGRLQSIAQSTIAKSFFPIYLNPMNQEHQEGKALLEYMFLFFINEGQISFRSIHQKLRADFSSEKIRIDYSSVYTSIIYNITTYFIWFFDSKENYLTALSKCQDLPINKSNVFGGSIFHELLIFSSQDLKTESDFESLKKSNSPFPILAKMFGSDKECSLSFSIDYSNIYDGKNKIQNLKYFDENKNDIAPIPEISFKSLYFSFILRYM